MKKGNRRAISSITTLALLFTTFFSVGVSFATESLDVVGSPELLIAPPPILTEPTIQSNMSFSDISGHWGETAIKEAVTNGFVRGYVDGTFKPDKAVTRAEFVTMVNKALQLRDENTVNLLYKDVETTNWFYKDIQKASYARYVSGVSGTSFMPGKNITREEAAAMLSRFLPKSGFLAETQVSTFPDSSSASTWAKAALAVVINKGYISGHANGSLVPQGALTRAEAAKIIGKILANETIVREDISVASSGDILKDKIYVGNITIEKSVGEGEATIDNLSALSKVYILGGGVNTVTIKDALVIQLIVSKEGTKVRVLSSGDTTIFETFVFNGNLLVDELGASANLGDSGYENIVNIEGTVSADDAIKIAQEIASKMDNSGKLTSEQIVQSVATVLPEMAMTINPDGSINVSVSGPVAPVATHHHSEGASAEDIQIATAAIAGVTVPVTGATPVAIITDTPEYTATISWSGTPTTFAAVTTYTAIITIAPKTDYTLTGVVTNYFTVAGATTTNSAASGVVSAAFPKTAVAPLPLTSIGSCGTSHAGIGAFTTIASINETTTVYAIYTEAQLQHLALHLNSNAILMNDLDFSSYAVGASSGTPMGALSAAAVAIGNSTLTTNLRVSSFTAGNFVPIGSYIDVNNKYPYKGTFYGNNKVISGLNITAAANIDYVGIFGYTSGAAIKDLTTNGGSVTGNSNVGGVVGSIITTTVTNANNTGNVSGTGSNVGGIVGNNYSSTITAVYNMSSVSGKTMVGGIIGNNTYGKVINSYNTGTVSGTGNNVAGVAGWNDTATITNSYNTGSVSGSSNVGGLAGFNSTATVEYSYNTGSVSGSSNVGGVVGINNNVSSIIRLAYNTGSVSGSTYVGGVAGKNNGTVSYSEWLIGSNLINSSGIGLGTISGTTSFSAVATTLTSIYSSMSAIVTSAGGVAVGAITDVTFSGTVTPTAFNGLQGSYIASGVGIGLTVTAISETTVTVTTASSLATLVSPGGIVVVPTSSAGDISTYNVAGTTGTWVMIKAVNAAEPSKNRMYTIYI